MVIREYQKKDEEDLVEVWFVTSKVAHNFIAEEVWLAHKDDLRKQYLPMAETWIAEENGELIGFVSLIENYIGGLFVQPVWQGKSVGRSLIDKAKAQRESLTVGVYKKNQQAKRFYARNGFEFVNEEVQEETGEIVEVLEWKGTK